MPLFSRAAPVSRTAPGAVLAGVAALVLGGCVVEVGGGSTGPLTTTAPNPDATPGASAPAGSGSGDGYAVLMTSEATGDPVTYSSCAPVRYVTNLQGAPEGVGQLVDEAVDRVAEATGLSFVDEGDTDEVATPQRDPRGGQDGDQGGDAWAPVLIAWTDPSAVPSLEGPPAGLGGSTAVTDSSGATAYVTGTVYLDGPDLEALLARRGGEALVHAVVLHELGHVVGLDHVDDRSQLMYGATTREVTDFQAGDLAGLALLGDGPCTEELAVPA